MIRLIGYFFGIGAVAFLGVAAAVSTSLGRSASFKDALLATNRTSKQTFELVAMLCVPLTLGVWIRAAVPNFLAADISFATTILLGVLIGPLAAMAGGATMAIPAVLHHEYLALPVNLAVAAVAGTFGRFADREDREREVHRYWTGSLGRLDTMPEQVGEVELGPGDGAYIPPYHPHWISNGDSTSLSLTVTFFDRSNADESMVQAFNEKLRRIGADPKVYGDAQRRDRAKVAFMRVYGSAKRLVRPDVSASH